MPAGASGVQALRSKGAPERRSRMTPGRGEAAWPVGEPDKGPAAHRWVEYQRWTLARVATVIARRFHVRFSPAQTWRGLHQMRFAVQVPLRRAAERDEDAVAARIRRPGPAWKDGEGPGRVAVLRG
ncbi:winged helix-turn-helix domain-containing protein [Streptomyces sp. NPDC001508]|uniref:helix-turn-helix domain-containing protein n=1 Tax=Streptomyces sp. NPDC001508 TaxID=3154656 RepID=UPI00331B0439